MSLLREFFIMTAAFVIAACIAVIQEVTLKPIPYLVPIGYAVAGAGLPVPLFVIWKIKAEEEVPTF